MFWPFKWHMTGLGTITLKSIGVASYHSLMVRLNARFAMRPIYKALNTMGVSLARLMRVVLEVNTRKEVLEEGGMEASLTQAVREGMANLDEVQLRARVASIPNELGAHEAFNHMFRMT